MGCVHDLTVNEISHLLSAKVNVTNCTLMHPTEDTVLSFDMLSGNKRYMFSDGRSYFTDVLKSLSLKRVIEGTMIRSFFDSYTAEQALSDWNKMDQETRSLFQKDNSPSELYRLFTSDIKRMLKRAVEQTMYSIDTTCNHAQRTFIQSLYYYAVLNMVPRMPVVKPKENLKNAQSDHSTTGYIYEEHIAHACLNTKSGVHLTHLVPPQEDSVIVFDFVAKRPFAFLYENGNMSPLDIVFFGGTSYETFTRRGSRLVQTHSLCETVIHLEKYLHGMESTHMKVLKELAFRSTVILQNAEDCEGHVPKKSKVDRVASDENNSVDPYVVQSIKDYKREIGDYWQMVSKTIKEITDGSIVAAEIPLQANNASETQQKSDMSITAMGNIVTGDGTNVMKLVQDLQSKQGPLGGPNLAESLAYIESGTSKLQRDFLKQQQKNLALRRGMVAWQKSHTVVCKRNEALMTQLLDSKGSHSMQTRAMTKLQLELDSAKSDLQRIRGTMTLPEKENNQKASDNSILSVNAMMHARKNDDYDNDTQQNSTHSIRYVNVSDSDDKKLRYLNANFTVPPVDESIRETAKNAWESEVRSIFFLRDHVYSLTGNHMQRQPSFDTTSVYLGGFCRQFMDFQMTGRVVFDSDFTSKTDTLEYMFACELEGSAIDLVNKMQS